MNWTAIAWFIFGTFIGSSMGVLLMAMLAVAQDADRRMEEEYNAQVTQAVDDSVE